MVAAREIDRGFAGGGSTGSTICVDKLNHCKASGEKASMATAATVPAYDLRISISISIQDTEPEIWRSLMRAQLIWHRSTATCVS